MLRQHCAALTVDFSDGDLDAMLGSPEELCAGAAASPVLLTSTVDGHVVAFSARSDGALELTIAAQICNSLQPRSTPIA